MDSRANELIQEGRTLRVQGDYEAALVAFEQAMSVDPTAPEPYRYAGQTKSYTAARLPKGSEKTALLSEAERLIKEAERRQRGESPDTLHDRAWIEDERGNFENAIALYERARDMVWREGRENKPIFSYNLACALIKGKQPQRAIETLAPVMDELWSQVEKDPDFDDLRLNPDFQTLLDDAKKKNG